MSEMSDVGGRMMSEMSEMSEDVGFGCSFESTKEVSNIGSSLEQGLHPTCNEVSLTDCLGRRCVDQTTHRYRNVR